MTLKRKPISSEMKILFVYFAIFELGVFFPDMFLIRNIVLTVLNVGLLISNKQRLPLVLMAASVMGDEIFVAINFIMAILFGRLKIQLSQNKKLWLVVIPILIMTALSAVEYGTYFSALFSIVYFAVLYFIARALNGNIPTHKFESVLKSFMIIEIIVFLSSMFFNSTFLPSDANFGTFGNAHLFGIWLMMAALVFIGDKISGRKIKENIGYLVSILLMAYFADAKAIVVMTIVAILLTPLYKKLFKLKRGLTIIFVAFFGLIYLGLGLLKIPIIEMSIKDLTPGVYPYMYSEGWNYKIQYFEGTLFQELPGPKLLLGSGMGQYGSRFANLLAYDKMYRENSLVNNAVASLLPPSSNPDYAKYITFYSNYFVSTIMHRSAIMSYPFASAISILAEVGIYGVIILSLFLEKQYKNAKYYVIILFLLLICTLDNYLDMFNIAAMAIMFLSIKKDKEEVCIEKDSTKRRGVRWRRAKR